MRSSRREGLAALDGGPQALADIRQAAALAPMWTSATPRKAAAVASRPNVTP